MSYIHNRLIFSDYVPCSFYVTKNSYITNGLFGHLSTLEALRGQNSLLHNQFIEYQSYMKKMDGIDREWLHGLIVDNTISH